MATVKLQQIIETIVKAPDLTGFKGAIKEVGYLLDQMFKSEGEIGKTKQKFIGYSLEEALNIIEPELAKKKKKKPQLKLSIKPQKLELKELENLMTFGSSKKLESIIPKKIFKQIKDQIRIFLDIQKDFVEFGIGLEKPKEKSKISKYLKQAGYYRELEGKKEKYLLPLLGYKLYPEKKEFAKGIKWQGPEEVSKAKTLSFGGKKWKLQEVKLPTQEEIEKKLKESDEVKSYKKIFTKEQLDAINKLWKEIGKVIVGAEKEKEKKPKIKPKKEKKEPIKKPVEKEEEEIIVQPTKPLKFESKEEKEKGKKQVKKLKKTIEIEEEKKVIRKPEKPTKKRKEEKEVIIKKQEIVEKPVISKKKPEKINQITIKEKILIKPELEQSKIIVKPNVVVKPNVLKPKISIKPKFDVEEKTVKPKVKIQPSVLKPKITVKPIIDTKKEIVKHKVVAKPEVVKQKVVIKPDIVKQKLVVKQDVNVPAIVKKPNIKIKPSLLKPKILVKPQVKIEEKTVKPIIKVKPKIIEEKKVEKIKPEKFIDKEKTLKQKIKITPEIEKPKKKISVEPQKIKKDQIVKQKIVLESEVIKPKEKIEPKLDIKHKVKKQKVKIDLKPEKIKDIKQEVKQEVKIQPKIIKSKPIKSKVDVNLEPNIKQQKIKVEPKVEKPKEIKPKFEVKPQVEQPKIKIPVESEAKKSKVVKSKIKVEPEINKQKIEIKPDEIIKIKQKTVKQDVNIEPVVKKTKTIKSEIPAEKELKKPKKIQQNVIVESKTEKPKIKEQDLKKPKEIEQKIRIKQKIEKPKEVKHKLKEKPKIEKPDVIKLKTKVIVETDKPKTIVKPKIIVKPHVEKFKKPEIVVNPKFKKTHIVKPKITVKPDIVNPKVEIKPRVSAKSQVLKPKVVIKPNILEPKEIKSKAKIKIDFEKPKTKQKIKVDKELEKPKIVKTKIIVEPEVIKQKKTKPKLQKQEIIKSKVKIKPEVEQPKIKVKPEIEKIKTIKPKVSIKPEVSKSEVIKPKISVKPDIKKPKVIRPKITVKPDIEKLKVEKPKINVKPDVEKPKIKIEPKLEKPKEIRPKIKVRPEVEKKVVEPKIEIKPKVKKEKIKKPEIIEKSVVEKPKDIKQKIKVKPKVEVEKVKKIKPEIEIEPQVKTKKQKIEKSKIIPDDIKKPQKVKPDITVEPKVKKTKPIKTKIDVKSEPKTVEPEIKVKPKVDKPKKIKPKVSIEPEIDKKEIVIEQKDLKLKKLEEKTKKPKSIEKRKEIVEIETKEIEKKEQKTPKVEIKTLPELKDSIEKINELDKIKNAFKRFPEELQGLDVGLKDIENIPKKKLNIVSEYIKILDFEKSKKDQLNKKDLEALQITKQILAFELKKPGFLERNKIDLKKITDFRTKELKTLQPIQKILEKEAELELESWNLGKENFSTINSIDFIRHRTYLWAKYHNKEAEKLGITYSKIYNSSKKDLITMANKAQLHDVDARFLAKEIKLLRDIEVILRKNPELEKEFADQIAEATEGGVGLLSALKETLQYTVRTSRVDLSKFTKISNISRMAALHEDIAKSLNIQEILSKDISKINELELDRITKIFNRKINEEKIEDKRKKAIQDILRLQERLGIQVKNESDLRNLSFKELSNITSELKQEENFRKASIYRIKDEEARRKVISSILSKARQDSQVMAILEKKELTTRKDLEKLGNNELQNLNKRVLTTFEYNKIVKSAKKELEKVHDIIKKSPELQKKFNDEYQKYNKLVKKDSKESSKIQLDELKAFSKKVVNTQKELKNEEVRKNLIESISDMAKRYPKIAENLGMQEKNLSNLELSSLKNTEKRLKEKIKSENDSFRIQKNALSFETLRTKLSNEINNSLFIRNKLQEKGFDLSKDISKLSDEDTLKLSNQVEQIKNSLKFTDKQAKLFDKINFLIKDNPELQRQFNDLLSDSTKVGTESLNNFYKTAKANIDNQNIIAKEVALREKLLRYIKEFPEITAKVGINEENIKNMSYSELYARDQALKSYKDIVNLDQNRSTLINKITSLYKKNSDIFSEELKNLEDLNKLSLSQLKTVWQESKQKVDLKKATSQGLAEEKKRDDYLKKSSKDVKRIFSQAIKDQNLFLYLTKKGIDLSEFSIGTEEELNRLKEEGNYQEIERRKNEALLKLSQSDIIDKITNGNKNDLDLVKQKVGSIKDINKEYKETQKSSEQRINLQKELLEFGQRSNLLRNKYGLEEEKIKDLTLDELKAKKEEVTAHLKSYSYLYRSRLELDRLASSFRMVGLSVGGLVVGLVKQATSFSMAMTKLTHGYNISSRQAIILSGIAESTGMSINQLTTAIGNYYQKLLTSGQGTSFVAGRVRDALKFAGLASVKLGENAESPIEALEKLRKLFERITDASTRAYIGQMVFGGQYEAMLPILTATEEEFKQLADTYEQTPMFSDKAFRKTFIFNAQIVALKNSFRFLGIEIINSVIGGFQSLVQMALNLQAVFQNIPKGLTTGVSSILFLIPVIALLSSSFIKAVTFAGRLSSQLLEVGWISDFLFNKFKNFSTGLSAVAKFLESTLGKTVVGAVIALGTAIALEIGELRRFEESIHRINGQVRQLNIEVDTLKGLIDFKNLSPEQSEVYERLSNSANAYKKELDLLNKHRNIWVELFGFRGGTSWVKYYEGIQEGYEKTMKELRDFSRTLVETTNLEYKLWEEVLSKQKVMSEIAENSTMLVTERFKLIEKIYNDLSRMYEFQGKEVFNIELERKEALNQLYEASRKQLFSFKDEIYKTIISSQHLMDFSIRKGTYFEKIFGLKKDRERARKEIQDTFNLTKNLYETFTNSLIQTERIVTRDININLAKVEDLRNEIKKLGQGPNPNYIAIDELTNQKIELLKQIDSQKAELSNIKLQRAKRQYEYNFLVQDFEKSIRDFDRISEYLIKDEYRQQRETLLKEEADVAKERLDNLKSFYKDSVRASLEVWDFNQARKMYQQFLKTVALSYDFELNQYIASLRSYGKTTLEIEKLISEKKVLLSKKYNKEYIENFLETSFEIMKNDKFTYSQRIAYVKEFLEESKKLAVTEQDIFDKYFKGIYGVYIELRKLEREIRLSDPLDILINELEKSADLFGSRLDKIKVSFIGKAKDLISSFVDKLRASSKEGFLDIGEILEGLYNDLANELIIVQAKIAMQRKLMSGGSLEEAIGAGMNTAMAYFIDFERQKPEVLRNIINEFIKGMNSNGKELPKINILDFFEKPLEINNVKVNVTNLDETHKELKNIIQSLQNYLDNTKLNISFGTIGFSPENLFVDKIESLNLQVKTLNIIPDSINVEKSGLNESIKNQLVPNNSQSTNTNPNVDIDVNMYGLSYPEVADKIKEYFSFQTKLNKFFEGG